MKNPFNSVRLKSHPRSLFPMQFSNNLTTNLGVLTPFFVKPTLPGDTWNNTSEIFVRFAPMLAPIMSNIDIVTHYFFVPNRLNFPDWEQFMAKNFDDDSDLISKMPMFDLAAQGKAEVK